MSSLTRRQFITTTSAVAAVALLPRTATAAQKSAGPGWTVGCFNRPWTPKFSYDETLDGLKAAGYTTTGLLTPNKSKGDLFTGSDATPEYLATLKQKIAARGLKVNMTALRVNTGLPLAEAIADTRKQIENGRTVGVDFALTFGEDKPERYANYFKIMSDAAAFAQERGIKLVMKPHGGGSGSSEEIVTAIKTVNHANFKIWYDAGNIIYYTGKDPVEELKPILQHVTGFCAKDCVVTTDAAGKRKPDVMIQFGAGTVDFAAVFKTLKSGGFNGPIMVECSKQGTLEETTANARANREFLEKVLATV
jgi:sugar phosphate isomerase/epimerase